MLIFSPPSSEYDSSQGPDKKRTVYQMALSKKSLSPLLSYCKRVLLNLEGTGGCSLKSSFSCLWLVLCSLSIPRFTSLLPCSYSVFVLDKLDEILAAAQHTITSDNQGQRGHGGKRDRSKSIVPNVSNEVLWEMEGTDLGITITCDTADLCWTVQVSTLASQQEGPFWLEYECSPSTSLTLSWTAI